MTELHVRLECACTCRCDGVVERFAALEHGCAVCATRLHLRNRCASRYENLACHAARASSERQRLGVVPSTAGSDAVVCCGAETAQLVECSANLEGPCALQVFGLEHDAAAAQFAQRGRGKDGRVRHEHARVSARLDN